MRSYVWFRAKNMTLCSKLHSASIEMKENFRHLLKTAGTYCRQSGVKRNLLSLCVAPTEHHLSRWTTNSLSFSLCVYICFSLRENCTVEWIQASRMWLMTWISWPGGYETTKPVYQKTKNVCCGLKWKWWAGPWWPRVTRIPVLFPATLCVY